METILFYYGQAFLSCSLVTSSHVSPFLIGGKLAQGMCLELVPQVVYNMEKLKIYSLDKHVKKHVKNLTTRNKLLSGLFKEGSSVTCDSYYMSNII